MTSESVPILIPVFPLCISPRSIRTALIPACSAPSMSFSMESPTINTLEAGGVKIPQHELERFSIGLGETNLLANMDSLNISGQSKRFEFGSLTI